MSPRAPTVCGQPGCPNDAVKAGRCAEHQRKAWRNPSASSSEIKANRPAWNRARKRALARARHRCEIAGCTNRATVVHHKTRIADGGDLTDMANLVCLCTAHHDAQPGHHSWQAQQRPSA